MYPCVSPSYRGCHPDYLLSLIEARRGNLVIARAVTEWKANGRENLRHFLRSRRHLSYGASKACFETCIGQSHGCRHQVLNRMMYQAQGDCAQEKHPFAGLLRRLCAAFSMTADCNCMGMFKSGANWVAGVCYLHSNLVSARMALLGDQAPAMSGLDDPPSSNGETSLGWRAMVAICLSSQQHGQRFSAGASRQGSSSNPGEAGLTGPISSLAANSVEWPRVHSHPSPPGATNDHVVGGQDRGRRR